MNTKTCQKHKAHKNIRSFTLQILRFAEAFTLVEMLMALLIVSVILSASLPVISQRQKAMASSYNQNRSFPIGGVILWTDMNKLPDNTWMECNGTAIPNGAEYEQARRIFGANTPDLRNTFAYSTNLNNYLKTDLNNYLQTNMFALPKNLIAIWGTNDAIPKGWSEADEYAGYFLRGYGTTPIHTQSWTDATGTSRTASTAYTSGAIGAVQGDATRNIYGSMGQFGVNISPYFFGDGSFVAMVYENNMYAIFIPISQPNAAGGWGTKGSFYFDASRLVPVSSEIRPVNKAVRYIKYTNTSTIPNLPEPPSATTGYRFIAKVRY